jgi:hypothetical protein
MALIEKINSHSLKYQTGVAAKKSPVCTITSIQKGFIRLATSVICFIILFDSDFHRILLKKDQVFAIFELFFALSSFLLFFCCCRWKHGMTYILHFYST